MEDDEALSVTVGKEETLIVIDAVALPPGPETVILYVVVDIGDTVIVPLIVVAPKFDEETLVALVEDQVSVVLPP